MMPTEHELATASGDYSKLAGRTAAVTPFLSGWSGHRFRRRREGSGHRLLLLVVTDERIPNVISHVPSNTQVGLDVPDVADGDRRHNGHHSLPCEPV